MSNLLRAGDLIGLPVVSIASGDDIAEVRDVVYDADDHRLVGFTLNKRGFLAGKAKAVLDAESVAAVGADAVTVDDESAVAQADEGPRALERPGRLAAVIGDRAVTSDGNDLGVVVDVVLSTGPDPEAVGYEIDAGRDHVFVPISAQVAVSGDHLLLPAEATDFVRNDLSGFGAAVDDYRATLEGGS